MVPTALAGTVRSVLGLDDVGTMRPASTGAAPSTPNAPSSCTLPGVGYPCTYNPQGFRKAYDATGTASGSQTFVAIFAEGDPIQVVKDLRTEESANSLPQVPVSVVPTGAPSSDTSGADEWDLDTQYSTGMAQSGSMQADDEAFAQAAAQGQTVLASAGDTGGFCPVTPTNGVPAGVPTASGSPPGALRPRWIRGVPRHRPRRYRPLPGHPPATTWPRGSEPWMSVRRPPSSSDRPPGWSGSPGPGHRAVRGRR